MRQLNMHEPQPRRLGLLRGHCQVPDDFDQLGAPEIADLFEGRWPQPSGRSPSQNR
jgi:hypothetical protein